MKNYSMGNSYPEAYITKNKQRVKQFNEIVYLNDGDNFEIEIFNPKKTKVLAKIKLDGVKISSSGIIVRPGERIFLERFLDTNNKFVYTTYKVNANNKQVKEAIKSNGNLDVEFFDLSEPTYTSAPIVNYDTYICGPVPTYNLPSYTNNPTVTPTWSSDNMKLNGTLTVGNSAFFSTSSGNVSYTNSTTPFTYTTSDVNLNSVETGMTEKGGKSNQEFEYVNDKFKLSSFYTINWKMMPLSTKPITAGEIKVFCTNCGTRKRKSSHKFCPNCGTKY